MQAVVLAAGASSRFWPLSAKRHKSLFRIGGQSLIGTTIERLREAGVDEVIVVQGPDRDIEAELDRGSVRYVVQDEPQGMADALQQAEDLLEDRFLVCNPYRANIDTLSRRLVRKQEDTDCEAVLLTRETDSPEDYGMIGHDGDRVTQVIEKPPSSEAPSDQRIVGLYMFTTTVFDHVQDVEDHEYALEDALDRMAQDGLVRYVQTQKDTSSIKYPWDLFDVADDLLRGQDQDIAPSAEVHDDALVEGPVIIEEGATVYENAVVRGPVYIGEDAIIGTNSIVRASSSIEEDVVVGANCEVRGSLIQPRTHLHQTYCGDSIIGRDVRVGAGTVFTNRNARKSGGQRRRIRVSAPKKDEGSPHELARIGAMVGDGTDIATQCNIMPGAMIGPDAFIGPSATVFDDVDGGTRLMTRFDNQRDER